MGIVVGSHGHAQRVAHSTFIFCVRDGRLFFNPKQKLEAIDLRTHRSHLVAFCVWSFLYCTHSPPHLAIVLWNEDELLSQSQSPLVSRKYFCVCGSSFACAFLLEAKPGLAICSVDKTSFQ